jgi:hypothetical protein
MGTLTGKNIAVAMNQPMADVPGMTQPQPTMLADNPPQGGQTQQVAQLTAQQIQQNKLQQLAQLQSAMKPMQTVTLANPWAKSQPWVNGGGVAAPAASAGNAQGQLYAMPGKEGVQAEADFLMPQYVQDAIGRPPDLSSNGRPDWVNAVNLLNPLRGISIPSSIYGDPGKALRNKTPPTRTDCRVSCRTTSCGRRRASMAIRSAR